MARNVGKQAAADAAVLPADDQPAVAPDGQGRDIELDVVADDSRADAADSAEESETPAFLTLRNTGPRDLFETHSRALLPAGQDTQVTAPDLDQVVHNIQQINFLHGREVLQVIKGEGQ